MVDSFTVFPAIDLRGGRVVRLTQGDPNRQTTYTDNPHHWAERWKDEGAEWLHVVNLDGAFGQDTFLNMQALETILDVGLKVEFGGGLRNQASITSVLSMGVKRVFLGTAAILDPVSGGLGDRQIRTGKHCRRYRGARWESCHSGLAGANILLPGGSRKTIKQPWHNLVCDNRCSA